MSCKVSIRKLWYRRVCEKPRKRRTILKADCEQTNIEFQKRGVAEKVQMPTTKEKICLKKKKIVFTKMCSQLANIVICVNRFSQYREVIIFVSELVIYRLDHGYSPQN